MPQPSRIVIPTQADKPLFDRLAQLYAYDFSEIAGNTIGPNGLYPSHECFTKIWTDPDRHPRLIFVGTEPAGFAFVHRIAPADHDIEQFFILRKFRRQGLGRKVAMSLFRAFPGAWTIEQITANSAAQAFWRATIADFTGGQFSDTGGTDPVQSFHTDDAGSGTPP